MTKMNYCFEHHQVAGFHVNIASVEEEQLESLSKLVFDIDTAAWRCQYNKCHNYKKIKKNLIEYIHHVWVFM